jgi:hypothetical protein
MKHLLFSLIIFFALTKLQAQIDTVNTQSDILKIQQVQEGKTSYIVYIQDSIYKSNFEIWDRTLTKNEDTYQLYWTRHTNQKNNFHNHLITFDKNMSPLSAKMVHQEVIEQGPRLEKKHFIYEDNQMYSDTDTAEHNTAAIKIDDLKYSFNWELDLEILGALPLADNKQFDICFYHPASKTPPQYYRYWVDRSETIKLNSQEMDCWVVKVVYSNYQSSEFWIDKSTYTLLQMKESFFGKFRFKKILL